MSTSVVLCDVPTSQDGSPRSGDLIGNDYLNDMAAGSDGRILLGGKTSGSFKATNIAEGDYVAVMLNTSALPVVSTTTSPPSAAEPSPLPSLTTAPAFSSEPSSRTSADTTSIIAGAVSAVVGVVVIALGCILRRRHIANIDHASNGGPLEPELVDTGALSFPLRRNPPPPSLSPLCADVVTDVAATERMEEDGGDAPPSGEALHRGMPPAVKPTNNEIPTGSARRGSLLQRTPTATANTDEAGGGGDIWASGGGGDGDGSGGGSRYGGIRTLQESTEPPTQARKDGGGEGGGRGIGVGQQYSGGSSLQQARNVTNTAVDISTEEGDEFKQAWKAQGIVSTVLAGHEPPPAYDPVNNASSTRRRGTSDGLLLGHAVANAAQELARNSNIPGVSDAAAAVSILAQLVMDNRDSNDGTEASLRRCRSIVLMLERAAKVLGKVSWRWG